MPPKHHEKLDMTVKKHAKVEKRTKEAIATSTCNNSDHERELGSLAVPSTSPFSQSVEHQWGASATLAERLQMRQYLKGKSISDNEDSAPPDDDSDSSDGSIIYPEKIRLTNKADAALNFKDAPGITKPDPIASSSREKSSKDVVGKSIQVNEKPVEKPCSGQGQNLDLSKKDDDAGCYYSKQKLSNESNTRKQISRAPLDLRIQPAPTAVRQSAAITTGRMAPQSPRSPTTATWWTGPAPIIVTVVGSACTDLPQLRNYVGEFLLRDYMSREDFLDLADLFWSCPHCRKILDDPVLHPCGHMACLKCVHDWVWHENSGPPCCAECAACLVPGCQAQFDADDQAGIDAHKQEWWDEVQVSLVLEETMRLIWRIYGSRRPLPTAHG